MKSRITVKYISGNVEQFDVKLFSGPVSEKRLQEFAESPTLLLRTPDEVIVIPASAIESISIAMPAEKLAEFKLDNVREARRVKS